MPPHRPLLQHHFRFRDGHTYSHTVKPPLPRPPPPPARRGGGGAESLARAGCSGARLTQRRRQRRRQSAGGAASAGRGGSRLGWEDRRGRGEGERAAERAGTHFRRETDPHTPTHGMRARHPQGGGSRQWVAPFLPPSLPLTLTRKWCCR